MHMDALYQSFSPLQELPYSQNTDGDTDPLRRTEAKKYGHGINAKEFDTKTTDSIESKPQKKGKSAARPKTRIEPRQKCKDKNDADIQKNFIRECGMEVAR